MNLLEQVISTQLNEQQYYAIYKRPLTVMTIDTYWSVVTRYHIHRQQTGCCLCIIQTCFIMHAQERRCLVWKDECVAEARSFNSGQLLATTVIYRTSRPTPV